MENEYDRRLAQAEANIAHLGQLIGHLAPRSPCDCLDAPTRAGDSEWFYWVALGLGVALGWQLAKLAAKVDDA